MAHRGSRNALFEKYLSGACTPEEIEILFRWFGLNDDEAALRSLIREALFQEDEGDAMLDAKVAAFTDKVGERLSAQISKRRSFPRRWLSIAAAIVTILSVGITAYLVIGRNDQPSEQLISEYGGEVLPGGNRATLRLGDGRIVELNAAQSGVVVGDEITYVDGSIVLAAADANKHTGDDMPAQPMSIATPKGGTYQIILPDGSKVWLNSASSLTYPVKFSGKTRAVALEGEAYFEVTKQAIPFIVKTRGQEVEVLGTQFNVSAYADDEETKTTLVEGKVNVVSAGERTSTVLQPNQQATLRGAELSVKDVNVAPFTDWRDGLFSFQETSLRDAMNQLSRWYDLEVTYDRAVSETYFFGKIKRNNSLSKVLNILKKSGLNFRIESSDSQKRLIVLP
ncbi:FecR family protein [Parapedobacter sp. DT-150]|uniref:FecR family protein n=1 Tax=Parapedobacter sp. DT-150 TaxID=3396162 RepID=UPI003F1D315A